jgi:hypothetical protein
MIGVNINVTSAGFFPHYYTAIRTKTEANDGIHENVDMPEL